MHTQITHLKHYIFTASINNLKLIKYVLEIQVKGIIMYRSLNIVIKIS